MTTGRRAVVTGAASGIGQAVARRLLREGVAVIAADDTSPARAAELLRAGANEVLLLHPDTGLPQQVCMYWMDDAARHATLAVAASLLRHLPAEALCIATAPAGRRDPARAQSLRALLDARSEARAAHALETRTELVPGEGPGAVAEFLAGLAAPLLVLGAAHTQSAQAALALLQARLPSMPVMLVYREARD